MLNKNIKTRLETYISLLSLITTIFFCVSVFHYSHVIHFNGLLASREINSPAVALAWLNGLTPYSNQAMPAYTNAYGIIQILIAMPFMHLVNNIFLPFRIISLISVLSVSFLVFLIVRKFSNKKILDYFIAVLFAIPIIGAQLSHEPFIAKPDSLGYFLYWLALSLPILLGKNFKVLLSAALIGLLAFLTKPYFVFAPLFILFVGFVNDFKTGLKLSLTFLTIFAVTATLLNHVFPWYWWNTFWIHYSYSFDYSRLPLVPNTLITIFHQHSYIFLLLGSGLTFLIISQSLKFRTRKVTGQFFKKYKNIISDNNYFYLYLLYASLPTLRLECFSGGAFIYFYQLYFPALVICTYLTFKYINNKTVWLLIALVLNLQTFDYMDSFIHQTINFPRSEVFMAQLNSYVSQTSGEIFADSNASSLIALHDQRIFDAAQNEYFAAPFQYPKAREVLLQYFPKKLELATAIYENHWAVIKYKINNRAFSMLILQSDVRPNSLLLSNIPGDLFTEGTIDRPEYFRAMIEKNYKKIATIKLDHSSNLNPNYPQLINPAMYPSLDIWVPRESSLGGKFT
jgi:hypothetical protein